MDDNEIPAEDGGAAEDDDGSEEGIEAEGGGVDDGIADAIGGKPMR